MKKIVNSLTVKPQELKEDMVMVATVTLHVVRGHDGNLYYRMYRCSPGECEGIPQGSRILNERAAMEALFPVVCWTDMKPDPS